MPTYEYRCRHCGERMDVFQKFSDKPLRVHEACGGELQKVFHPSGIVFKGSGYYVTDSRSKSSSSTSSNGSTSGEDKSAKSESKTSDKSDKTGKTGNSDSSAAAAAD